MSSGAEGGTSYDVLCPHCKKPFTADLLAGRRAAHHGFKCPHCRLFVPFERADGDQPVASGTP